MIIETENLKKVYRTEVVETTAVDDVNFTLSEGQFVSVMGPSGCGKSTLLHLLGLIDSPSGFGLSRAQARADPQGQHRLRVPELQPDRRAHGLRERRIAARVRQRGRA
jgi:ABC-type lipoprotein export system ATPase subunit